MPSNGKPVAIAPEVTSLLPAFVSRGKSIDQLVDLVFIGATN
jgi:hypothetical protein